MGDYSRPRMDLSRPREHSSDRPQRHQPTTPAPPPASPPPASPLEDPVITAGLQATQQATRAAHQSPEAATRKSSRIPVPNRLYADDSSEDEIDSSDEDEEEEDNHRDMAYHERDEDDGSDEEDDEGEYEYGGGASSISGGRRRGNGRAQEPITLSLKEDDWETIDPERWNRETYKHFSGRLDLGAEELGQPTVREHGGMGVNAESQPLAFFLLFWPLSLFKNILVWSNAYAAKRRGEREEDEPEYYKDFKPFALFEILRFFALLLKHGACPQPGLERRFTDPLTSFFFGDQRDINLFRSGFRRVQHLRTFLHFQDPLAENTDSDVLWKVRPVIHQLRTACEGNWLPGRRLSGDEMTIYTRAKSGHKKRIKFKKHGDGVQAEALCERGYTYTFIFRMETPPKHPKFPNLSDLHLRQMFLLLRLPYEYHEVFFDNLYISVKFILACLHLKRLVGGTCRTNGKGIPKKAIIPVPKTKAEQEKARGELMSATKTRAHGGVLCFGIFDKGKKPTYFMGLVWRSIEKLTLLRSVWDAGAGSLVDRPYHRTSVQHEYNFNMNGVDVADHLRDMGRPDGPQMRNRKWYWPIMLWALGVAMVNAYLVYKWYRQKAQKPVMTQWEFRDRVAMGLIGMAKRDEEEGGGKGKKRKKNSVEAQMDEVAESQEEDKPRSAKRILNKEGEKDLRVEDLGAHTFEVLDRTRHDTYCQLCFWQKGTKPLGHMYCLKCNKNLCLDCWLVWHSNADIGRKY